jgi:2-keto-4-pentenoate hydratase
MTQDRINRVADWIEAEQRARKRFVRLTGDLAPASLAECYAIQDRLAAAFAAEDGPVGAYKIALTSPAVQKLCGVDSPAGGLVHANNIHKSPWRAAKADFVRLGIEFELAVILGEDVKASDAPWDRAKIADRVAALAPAFELIDDRDADYADLDGHSIAADRCWNAGIVLGEPVTDWRGIDLARARTTMTLNGNETETGSTGAALGHPLDALAWLANEWAAHGRDMKAGSAIMTGSVIATRFPNPGDRFVHEIEGLGKVELEVTA